MGLLGSKFYVASLSQEELSQISVMINLDMLGSPNFYRGVYNGEQAAVDIRNGSVAVTNLFVDFFNKHGLAYGWSAFDGRSDYQAFINVCARGH
jgi:Zn-dependent M28 family amino/carboxypeptidase